MLKLKEENEKAGLKLNIQNTKIMASGPITSWQRDGETMETVRAFIFWYPKSLQMVTAAMKSRHLLLGRKAMTNLGSILKSRHYFADMGHLVKAMLFPVVMCGCESWTINKAECQRTDAFELWYWRRLESPLDCKDIQPVNPKGNQS